MNAPRCARCGWEESNGLHLTYERMVTDWPEFKDMFRPSDHHAYVAPKEGGGA
jgi:hypothetical protein